MGKPEKLSIISFFLIYILSTVYLAVNNVELLFSLLPFSIGILALSSLILLLTRRRTSAVFELRRPVLLLVVFVACLAIFWTSPFPSIGGQWGIHKILRKMICLFLIPLTYLLLKEKGYVSFAFSPKNVSLEIKTALIISLIIAIPTFLYNPANRGLLSSETPLSKLLISIPVSIVYYLLFAGIPEEFFFRALLQESLMQFLDSEKAGLVVSCLIFAYLHVPSIVGWYGIPIVEAFARATMIQAALGFTLGLLWIRNRSLMPLIIFHTVVDASSNLSKVIQLIAT